MTGGVNSVSTRCEDFVKKRAQQASMKRYTENGTGICAGTAGAGFLSGLLVTRGEFFQVLTIAFFYKSLFWNKAQ